MGTKGCRQSETEALRKEVEGLETRIKELDEELEEFYDKNASLRKQLKEKDKIIAAQMHLTLLLHRQGQREEFVVNTDEGEE